MRRSAAVAFALEAISEWGEPVAGVGHNHVLVRLSQQELARRTRCAPSTVAWYLRQLGPAVVDRRHGLVFDREALAGLDAARPELAPRTVAVERELLDAFARPAADGTRPEFLCGPATTRPASLQDFAFHLGINRSSAHRHVRALEEAGRLQRRGRRLYIADCVTPTTKEPPVDDRSSDTAHLEPKPVTTEQVLQLLDKVADVMGMVVGIVGQLLPTGSVSAEGQPEPRPSGARDSRLVGARTGAEAELRAVPAADGVRGSFSGFDLIDKIDPQITSNQPSARGSDSRVNEKLRVEHPRSATDWTAEQLPDLLAPLLEECDRRSLPGVADAQRVIASLRLYTADQVRAAARQMAADLRSGAPMRSPIAILVRKAEDGDPYYFRCAPLAEQAKPAPALVERDEPVDHHALTAVASLDDATLEQLDAAVRTYVGRILGPELAASALRGAETMAHWRPIVWRLQQPLEPTAREQA